MDRGRAAIGWLRAFLAVLVRPRLWWVAIRQTARLARPAWWRRAPFLPLPPADYLRFRLETAYGAVVAPEPRDLVAYLDWCADATRVADAAACRSQPAVQSRQ